MSSNPFLSKEINSKRILKGVATFLPVVMMIAVIGNYYVNLIDNTLRDHYTQGYEVLGTQSEFEKEYFSQYEETTQAYDIEEYVYGWNWTYNNLTPDTPKIDMPKTVFNDDTSVFKRDWSLNNEFILSMECEEKDLDQVLPGESYGCSVKYNDQLLEEYARYYINGEDKIGEVSLKLFSTDNEEYLLLGTYAGGSYDDITILRLIDGDIEKLTFHTDSEDKDTWTVTYPLAIDFYINNDKIITKFHNPAYGGVRVFRVWDLNNDLLTLEKTVGGIME